MTIQLVLIGPRAVPVKDYAMRENHVRENIASNFVTIQHVSGKLNLADLFTKEMKDVGHFVELRDLMLRPRLIISQSFI